MRIPISFHDSKIATVFSLAGSGLMVIGVFALRTGEIIPCLLMMLAGVAMFGLSILVNKLLAKSVQNKRIKKALKNPMLIYDVQKSALLAFSIYRKNPHELISEFVMMHNPFAYERILDFNSKKYTEQEIIAMLRKYDSINSSGNV